MAPKLQHIRSTVPHRRPDPALLIDGQMAQNQAVESPGLFIKDANGGAVKIGPIHLGAVAPNATPAGSAGNSIGEAWLDTGLARPVLKIWNGTEWVPVSGSGGGCAVGETAPTAPEPGDLWFRTDICQLFVWYDDGDTQQWVQANSGGGGGGDVTPIAAGVGLTGGTITDTGSVALDTAYTDARYVNVTGDVMSGDLFVQRNGETIVLSPTGTSMSATGYATTYGAYGVSIDGKGSQVNVEFVGSQRWGIVNAGTGSPSWAIAGDLTFFAATANKPAAMFRQVGGTVKAYFGNTLNPTAFDAAVNIEEAILTDVTPLRVEARGTTNANLTRWTKGGTEVARIANTGAYFNNSDERLKTNVQPMPYGLAEVQQLNPKTFNWIYDQTAEPQTILGVIAQEVQQVIPEIISEGSPDPDGNTFLGIDSTGLIHVLINAVKELSSQVEELTARIAALEAVQ